MTLPRCQSPNAPGGRPCHQACQLHKLSANARLVARGFRGWMSGLQTADLRCWEQVWRDYTGTLGGGCAAPAIAGLAAWVQSVNRHTLRPIALESLSSGRYCHDECMAVSIVAAAQNETCPAMRACAYALLGTSDVDPVVSRAEAFAGTLKSAGVVIEPSMIANAAAMGSRGSHVRLEH